MDLAQLAHLHLLLNHVPTLGFVLGLATFVVSFREKGDELRRFSLGVFFIVAIVALPAYTTGYGARLAIREQPGYSEALVETHQGAALFALVFMEATGLLAWLALWQGRRTTTPIRWIPAILPLAFITLLLMAAAGNVGGQISHPEIRATQELPAAPSGYSALLTRTSLDALNSRFPFAWPMAEVVHFVGLAVFFGIILMVNLRMLGVMRGASFADLHRALPWAAGAFAANTLSGMFFFALSPQQYTQSPAFYLKLTAIVLAATQVLYLTYFDQPWAVGRDDDPPMLSKVVAGTQLLLWVAVLYFGRMLPYIGGTLTQ